MVLIFSTPVAVGDVVEGGEHAVEDVHQLFGRQSFGQLGEADDVAEQHRHLGMAFGDRLRRASSFSRWAMAAGSVLQQQALGAAALVLELALHARGGALEQEADRHHHHEHQREVAHQVAAQLGFAQRVHRHLARAGVP